MSAHRLTRKTDVEYTCPRGHRSWRWVDRRRQYWCPVCRIYFESLADAGTEESTG